MGAVHQAAHVSAAVRSEREDLEARRASLHHHLNRTGACNQTSDNRSGLVSVYKGSDVQA